MRNVTFTIIAVLSLLFTSINAQIPSEVNWALTANQNVSSVAGWMEGQAVTGTGIMVRDYTGTLTGGVPGPLGLFQRWWTGDLWPNQTAPDSGRYIEFSVNPVTGYNLNVTGISLYLNAGGTGNMAASLYYSTDPDFTTPIALEEGIAVSRDSLSFYDYFIDAQVADGQKLFFRVYPYLPGGSTSNGKYVFLQDATISGTASLVTYPASAQWELTDPATGGTGLAVATAGLVAAADERLNNMEINHYTGPDNSQRARIAGNAWPANQTTQLDSVYIEFAISPQSGYTLYATSLSLGIAAASINTMKANIYFSSDPNFANPVPVAYSTGDTINNYLRLDSLTWVTAEPGLTVNSGETFFLRIYPWVDNNPSVTTGKYVCLKNVIIGGEIEGNPVAASVQWAFQNSEDPVTSGPIVAYNPDYSDAMAFYDYTQLPRTDTSGTVTVGAVQTVSQNWIAAPDPVDSLWFQFAVEPKFGGTLFVDSLSLYIGGWFSNNFRAEFYYSKDSTFTIKTLLIADTSLVGNAVMPLGAGLSETVATGEKFYLRVYPHHTTTVGWAKLIAIYDVRIFGTVTGVTADPPVITTRSVTNISTMYAVSGGTISNDGGAPVTIRGVAWNTIGSPTTSDNTTNDGQGSGTFTSMVTGLTPATTYYLRAYATNDAGTSYGQERTFVTLDSLSAPGVITGSVSNILAVSVEGSGVVTDWGGDTVLVRGFCWNTTGNPTLADSYSENGSGTGAFSGTLYPLTPNTPYYVRAYATNSKGTGYGNEVTFTTQQQAPNVTKVVDASGNGDYTTVQEAFDAVPDFYTGRWTLFVKSGVYYEKLFLHRNKVNVVLIGVHPDSTILTYDDYAGIAGGTSNSYSVAIEPDDFTAYNITFQNTVVNDGSVPDQQAVALRVNGDRQAYYNCNILGYQDTFYAWGGRGTGRVYLKNCYIEGSVDFIFGRDIVLFDSCEIRINRNVGSLTAASTEADSRFGFVFSNCILSADSIGFNGVPITSFILGRPWQAAPRTAYLNCYEPASVNPAGWQAWNVSPALYAEYNCYGPGADTTSRIIGEQLSAEEAAEYTIDNIFAKTSNPAFGYNWLPSSTPTYIDQDRSGSNLIPDDYRLEQNYPNPFNPSTTIKFQVPQAGKVKLIVYNILGQVVETVFDGNLMAGYYHTVFDARNLASGVYFYHIDAGGRYRQVRKMVLLK